MDLAVLGTDPDVLTLVEAAVADSHRVVWFGDVRAEDQSAMRSLIPSMGRPVADWETLLDQGTANAVLVGRGTAGDELRAEQLKRLVTDGIPLLVVHPTCLSVLTYYELDMVRRETGAILRHYNPLAGHPVLEDLAGRVQDGDETIGDVLQLTCTREVISGARDEVLTGLARDVEVLAAVAGGIRHVTAIGPQATGEAFDVPDGQNSGRKPSFASLQVQLRTPSPATLRWSVVPTTAADPQITLTLIGERGSLTWNTTAHVRGAQSEDWLQLKSRDAAGHAENQELACPTWDAPQSAIRQLAAAVAEETSERRRAGSTWARATIAMEVVDAVDLSLQKGRTIEVHQQQLTEQLAFRGTMAALGCGLLLVSFVVMLVVAFVGGVEWFLQKKVVQSWAIGLLAALTFFLAVQFVPYLSSKDVKTASDDDADFIE